MLTGPTLDRLHALNLGGMARALAEQRENPAYAELPFEDRLGMLVDREATDRENRRLERYLRAAKLRVAASVEDVDFRAPRGLDRFLAVHNKTRHLEEGGPRDERIRGPRDLVSRRPDG